MTKWTDVLEKLIELLKSFEPASWDIKIKMVTKKGGTMEYVNKGPMKVKDIGNK